MRLLRLEDDSEFSLVEFIGKNIPPYAVLSHTWGPDDEEVTFKDLVDGAGKGKTGYSKIRFCGEQAAYDGLQFSWVDTCCIDKSSSTELSEAITSMFRWYQKAKICYVYLTDVSASENEWESAFRTSRWFTRGWTLQELLAPETVKFYSKEGQLLGTKGSLERLIHEITGIEVDALQGTPLTEFSVEQRMLWAEHRDTKCEEDKYYSLLGIFDVSMSLLYGEGQRHAELRLRREIDLHIKAPRDMQDQKDHRGPRDWKELVESLRFDGTDNRYHTIKSAHVKTCRWFLNNPKYREWLNGEKLSKHHGLLWLKGKPGAGKSTMMKYVLDEARKSKGTTPLYFFFNARGSTLEKDTVGMYRSLLYQLFTWMPDTRDVFNDFTILELPRKPYYAWGIGLLKDLLARSLRKIHRRPLSIFIDALDECDEDEVRHMVRHFEILGEEAMTSKTRLLIFFSSRHYPRITVTKKVEVILENEIEHARDIASYISNELRLQERAPLERIRTTILERASGVFIWVVFVVQILKKADDHGQVTAVDGMEEKLREIPDDLGEIFKSILNRDTQNISEMKLCVQWILFANRPLAIEELYYAILSGTRPKLLKPWNPKEITTEVMERFILSSSKGLAEFTSSHPPTVQFIHESVRDFLLSDNGKQYFQESSNTSFLGLGHDLLRRCCENFLTSQYVKKLMSKSTNSRKTMDDGEEAEDLEETEDMKGTEISEDNEISEDTEDPEETLRQACVRLPCLEYAIRYTLYHAEDAGYNSISQASFLQTFPVQKWIRMRNVIAVPARPMLTRYDHEPPFKLDSSVLYILAERNLPTLIKTWLAMKPSIDIVGGKYGLPIFVAMERKNTAAIEALLTPRPADPSNASLLQGIRAPKSHEIYGLVEGYLDSHWTHKLEPDMTSLLWFFLKNGIETAALTLLRSGWLDLDAKDSKLFISPLAYAAGLGCKRIVSFLVDTKQVDIESRDPRGQTPLSRAAQNGRESIVLLLNKAGANINSQSDEGQTPLANAAKEGHDNVVKTLLGMEEVQPDSRDKMDRTPFFYAAARGHEAIVRLFLEAQKADINPCDIFGQTPLICATLHGHERNTKLLLNSQGVHINSQDNKGRSPLSFAAQYGYRTLVSLFIKQNGIQIDSRDERGRTPFSYATLYGKKDIVKLLLETGNIDLSNRDNEGQTPLIHAISQWHINVVELLLEHSRLEKNPFDIHARDEDSQTDSALQWAAGNSKMSTLLKEHCGCHLCMTRK